MGLQESSLLTLLLALGCRPAYSFVVSPANGRTASPPSPTIFTSAANHKFSTGQRRQSTHRIIFRDLHACRSTRATGREGRAEEEDNGTPPRALSPSGEALSFISHDGVSYLQNPETASEIWLVGVVHGATASVELMEAVVREIKPQVVMLELDVDRLDCLPPGEAQMTDDGLNWFTAELPPDETDTSSATTKANAVESANDDAKSAPSERKRRRFGFVTIPAAKLFIRVMEAIINALHEDASEMEAAVREAQACEARVLLGDRCFKETKQQLVSAGLADSIDDERLDDPEALLKDSMSVSDQRKFANLRLTKPETRETAREYYAALGTMCDPRALKAMIPERDEVMARNLMGLDGAQTTVAIIGIFHVDGIENILMSNGWQRRLS